MVPDLLEDSNVRYVSTSKKVPSAHLFSAYARDVVRYKFAPHWEIYVSFLLYIIYCNEKKKKHFLSLTFK